MRKYSTLVCLSTLLVGIASACSDPEGSYVGNGSNTAGKSSTSGGSPSAGGSGASLPDAGERGSLAGAGTTPEIPTEACKGLPIDLSDDAQGGAASAAGGGPNEGGAPGEPRAGAPAETAGAGGAGPACRGISVEAEVIPVDLFLMMDRSQSMGFSVEGSSMTRWEALREAVETFVTDPAAAEIGGGIGFFSLSGGANDELDCNADDYAEPVVPIAPLGEVGADLIEAIEEVTPGGLTPTVPALEGAINYARAWQGENPDRASVVVLVTDGFPTQCSTAPDEIAAVAKAGYDSDERVRTFVIGVGEVARFNLDNYARAGGTQQAYLTEADDVSSSFVEALTNITSGELACEYRIPAPPDDMKIDVDEVQVIYTPAAGDPEEVPSISSLSACAKNPNGGWYYDDAANPTKISVCPCTCARFRAGRVDVRLGCKPRVGVR